MELQFSREIDIPVGKKELKGDLIIPKDADAIIVFSHGSGSSRLSIRNRAVAEYLHKNNFGTLLFDLLTHEEDLQQQNRFDINLLTKRLIEATEFLQEFEETKYLRVGYFGASTGAASALKAAAFLPFIGAVVSRGGRPDLAADVLSKVDCPTLLLIGSLDPDVLELNKQALAMLNCDKRLEIIEGATHLFEEPGKMDEVASLAAAWFKKYLAGIKIAH